VKISLGLLLNDWWRYDPLVNEWYFVNGNTTVGRCYWIQVQEMDIQDQDMDIHLQRFQMIQSSFSEDMDMRIILLLVQEI